MSPLHSPAQNFEHLLQSRESDLIDPLRGGAGGVRLEREPDVEEIVQSLRIGIEHEDERLCEQGAIQSGDVRAAALTLVEDSHRCQGVDRLSHGGPRNSEQVGERPLWRQPFTGSEGA